MTVMRCAACCKTLATCQCATGGLVRSGIGRADADIAPTPKPYEYPDHATPTPRAASIEPPALCYAGEEIKPQINNGRLQFIPEDSAARKEYPIATGCLDYFPDALAEVAHVSHVATQQHHAGEPLHWDRNKSADEANTLARHFMQRGQIDTDGVRHSAKVAWRALALLQKEIEADATQMVNVTVTVSGSAPSSGAFAELREAFQKPPGSPWRAE